MRRISETLKINCHIPHVEKNLESRINQVDTKLGMLKGQTKLTFTWHTPNRVNI